MKNNEILNRFLLNAEVGEPDECWVWKGPVDKKLGYGRTSFLGYSTTAPKTSWILANDAEPPKYINNRRICIRHLCGNRLCVNPNHLALGTYSDNGRDASELGKHVKFNIIELKQMIKLRKEGKTYREIGKIFNTSESNVSNALNGRCHCYRQMIKKLH